VYLTVVVCGLSYSHESCNGDTDKITPWIYTGWIRSEDTLRIRGAMPVRVNMDDTGRMVNRKTKTDKNKTDTNPIPDPNRSHLIDELIQLTQHDLTLLNTQTLYSQIRTPQTDIIKHIHTLS